MKNTIVWDCIYYCNCNAKKIKFSFIFTVSDDELIEFMKKSFDGIACKLVKRNIQDLSISTAELNKIYLMFENKDKVEIENIINVVYTEICNELILDNE